MIKALSEPKGYAVASSFGLIQLILLLNSIKLSIQPFLLFQIVSIAFAGTSALFLFIFFFENLEKKIIYPIFTHFLDASSTVMALESGLKEKAYIARLFIDLVGAYGVFLMKLLIIGPISYYLLEKYEGKWKEEAFFFLVVYGFVLFLRNYFLILMI